MTIKFHSQELTIEAKFQDGVWYVGIEYADGDDCGFVTSSFEEVIACF